MGDINNTIYYRKTHGQSVTCVCVFAVEISAVHIFLKCLPCYFTYPTSLDLMFMYFRQNLLLQN